MGRGEIIPKNVSNLTLTPAGTSIVLSWTDNSNNEDGFIIQRGTYGGSFTSIDTVTGTTLSNTGLSYGTGYKYKVITYKGSKLSTGVKDSVITWTWPKTMMESYVTINSHSIFTQTEKDTIEGRLATSYMQSTFGPAGQNKTICDFFMIFWNSNTSTALETRTNTKTGATLRWNYGNGNIYSQNNLPANINNGVITVTSVDGFSTWTIFSIISNTFVGNAPRVWPGMLRYQIYNNNLSGGLPNIRGNVTVQQYLAYNNPNLYSQCPYIEGCSSLTSFDINGTSTYGRIGSFLGCSNLDNYIATNTRIIDTIADTRNAPKLRLLKLNNTTTASNSCFYAAKYISGSGYLSELNFKGQFLSTTDIDTIIRHLYIYYHSHAPSVNLTVDVSNDINYSLGNGMITGGESNSDVIGLRSAFTSAGKTLTLNYNSVDHKLTEGYVIFTCDDGYTSQYELAYKRFKEKNSKFTMYMTSGPNYPASNKITWVEAKEMQDNSFDVQGHGYTHAQFSTLSESDLRKEFTKSDSAFTVHGLIPPSHEAYPYSNSSDAVKTIISEYRLTGRNTTDRSVVDSNFDPYNLKIAVNLAGMTDATFYNRSKWIDFAKYAKVGVIFMFHNVSSDYSNVNDVNIEQLVNLLDYALQKNIKVITISQLYNNLQ
jgi:peptidoglycan/xylan/chitin deacetylase (PgdA/CDA1 family)